jgi:hypothetical protein
MRLNLAGVEFDFTPVISSGKEMEIEVDAFEVVANSISRKKDI